MAPRTFYLLFLPLLMLAGYGIGNWQQSGLWSRDLEMVEMIGIRSGQVPAPTTNSTADAAASGAPDVSANGAEHSRIRFESISHSGIDFTYVNGPEGQFHLAETLGGGVAAVDFDSDGDDDIIFVNGGDPVTWPDNTDLQIALFRQKPDRHFSNAAESAGFIWTGYGHGCAVTDFNNDGFDDLLVTGYQHSALYLNQGDGTFLESGAVRPLAAGRWCATADFCDLDHDGDPDVYISCYANTPRTMPAPVCESDGQRIHCHPHHYEPVSDLLLENTGDGRLRNQSQKSGITDWSEYGLGVTIADLDRDGNMDIFVANDGSRNLLFQPRSPWAYNEQAISAGVAYNGGGERMGAMGVACADFNRNGWLDLLVTNFAFERNVLFSNLGNHTYVDESQNSPLDLTSRSRVGWSAVTLDANLDGYTDLFVTNGHVTRMPSEPYAQSPDFYVGTSSGLQAENIDSAYFSQSWHGRGAARCDLNSDGRDDLVVSHIDSPASLLQNTSEATGQFIALKLCGVKSARSADGAVIDVTTPGGVLTFPYNRNAGYLSSHSSLLRIGIGNTPVVSTCVITWPSGDKQQIPDVRAGTTLTVVEGRQPLMMKSPDDNRINFPVSEKSEPSDQDGK